MLETNRLRLGKNRVRLKFDKFPSQIFNLTVNPYETFFAGGLLVHNKKQLIEQPPGSGDDGPRGALPEPRPCVFARKTGKTGAVPNSVA